MGNRPVSPLPPDAGRRKSSLRKKFELLYARRFSKVEEESTIIPRRIPVPGEEIDQWMESIKVMTRLKGGVPHELRKKLWLKLASAYHRDRGIDWNQVKEMCFLRENIVRDDVIDEEIFKDLHRTGSDHFTGESAEWNQALLKRVLVAYSKYNPLIGYCQGFNILAAVVLEVLEWDVEESLKVMIYLIEGVFPDGYFGKYLFGLRVDMAVVDEMITILLPALNQHMSELSFEKELMTESDPPLVNMYTMQWFMTLFSNCLPRKLVLRIWDLILIEGNEILIRTALGIWEYLSEKIKYIDSAEDFCYILNVLMKELRELDDEQSEQLVENILSMVSFPFPRLDEFRDKYRNSNLSSNNKNHNNNNTVNNKRKKSLSPMGEMFSARRTSYISMMSD